MILTAENPHLETVTRVIHRKAEAQVRSIVLNIYYGIAVNHPRVQPVINDPVERDALVGIINKTKDLYIMPGQ
ncbi:hypothetical protein N7466_005428 [Penicillium verhagenii]|uniref:uncharacterized protein n=1 Tax=Penicillium verhagenii TaxID=1562060 RepID=UPI002545B655|nr:uncharacterized protein N7466_005428 [Penicillium verhagenii]KAJ5929935.1 hypothetical protein N7466_005428 [Penicillium verhagenii]